MSKLDKDSDSKLIWQRCWHALQDEYLSREFYEYDYEHGLNLSSHKEDETTLQLLQEKQLALPREDIALHDILRIWSISGHHRDIPEKIENLLVAEGRGNLTPFRRLGIREGNQWIRVSEPVNKNKPA